MQALPKADDRRRLKGKESRQLILQSAITCIATQGLSFTTLDRVAERAGVSRALVVFHFKSKSGLLKEVLGFLGARYGVGRDAVTTVSEASTMEKLLQLLDYDVRFASENPEFLSAWHAFWGEAKGNLLYRELSVPRDERYARETNQLITTLIEEGGYDQNELLPLHTGLTAMLFGLWVESHLNSGPDDYSKGMAAVRLFLSKAFPKHPLPPVLTESQRSDCFAGTAL
jgi:AcrR family transcriptional regulator